MSPQPLRDADDVRTLAIEELLGEFAGLRSTCTALGFRELVVYTRRSERQNYTCMLVTPDGLTLAHVWVGRSYGVQRAVSMLMSWPAFKRELFAAPRYSLTTEFSGTRRFDTTMVEFLARSQVDGEIEFLIVPPEMPLAEVVERHRAGAQAFAAKVGAPPAEAQLRHRPSVSRRVTRAAI